MDIIINEVLRSYIEPLTAHEYAALERSLLAEGCRDALVLWNDILIDGHSRYAICRQHGIAFNTVQHAGFSALDDVKLWMIDNHLARRSVSDFQRGVLALRKKEMVAAKVEQGATPPPERFGTREEIAKAARLSSNILSQIEKIHTAATPELVAAVRAGTISINAAATVAALPQEQQLSAVAGGKKQLQLAAREVRAQRSAARPPKLASDSAAAVPNEASQLRADCEVLTLRNAALEAENARLHQRIAALIDAT